MISNLSKKKISQYFYFLSIRFIFINLLIIILPVPEFFNELI